MKEGIHPDYHRVLFIDTATGNEWITRSTLTSKETREVDGEQIPVVKLEVSSYSHPFWTGKMRELDSDGKIGRYRRRFGGGNTDLRQHRRQLGGLTKGMARPKGCDIGIAHCCLSREAPIYPALD